MRNRRGVAGTFSRRCNNFWVLADLPVTPCVAGASQRTRFCRLGGASGFVYSQKQPCASQPFICALYRCICPGLTSISRLKPHACCIQVNLDSSPITLSARNKRSSLEQNLCLGSKQLPEKAFFADKSLYNRGRVKTQKNTICFT